MDEKKRVRFFNTLTQNGWMPIYDKEYKSEDTYAVYEFTLIAKFYKSRCFAHIAESVDSINIGGHLGVGWVVVEYEYNDRPYGYNDLEDMKEAINCAEKNLLEIGMPFQDNKSFHGSEEEKAEKIKRNNELREKWELEEIEKIYWQEYKKQWNSKK